MRVRVCLCVCDCVTRTGDSASMYSSIVSDSHLAMHQRSVLCETWRHGVFQRKDCDIIKENFGSPRAGRPRPARHAEMDSQCRDAAAHRVGPSDTSMNPEAEWPTVAVHSSFARLLLEEPSSLGWGPVLSRVSWKMISLLAHGQECHHNRSFATPRFAWCQQVTDPVDEVFTAIAHVA